MNEFLLAAAIFDMDGLLIDSEPLWERAEIDAFGSVGLSLDRTMCRQTMGLRSDEVVRYWYERYPWRTASIGEVEALILSNLIKLVAGDLTPMPGALELIKRLADAGMKLAVASSSPHAVITAVVNRLRIAGDFSALCSAEHQPYGKPHPGVFIESARQLGCQPSDCVVFEDSINGVIAAKAARMRTVAVPDPSMFDRAEYSIADLKVASLSVFEKYHFQFLRR
jgi:mannitol-1-/sugar-/sorbitol-6-/2-deoxyglucose-6-phosphatase